MTRPSALVLALAIAVCALGSVSASSATAAPDPISDADGDAIPYAWETPPEVAVPAPSPNSSQPAAKKKCKKGKRLTHGKCVPTKKKKKCPKGKKLRHGRCVRAKKGRPPVRGTASVSSGAPAPNVASLGADPNHKDIFVEIDYANPTLRQNVSCGELDRLVTAFADAPVSNPDGKPGINLHIDAGVNCPSRSYDLVGSKVFDSGSPCPSTGEAFNADQLPEGRVGTFHLAAFVPQCGGGGGEGGAATLHGIQMVVFTEGGSFAHPLMHELGHNLGLDHPYGLQPNRISEMNTTIFTSPDGNGSSEALDYNRVPLPALDEEHLSEEAGISAPPQYHDNYVLHHCPGEEPASQGTFVSAWPGDGAIDWNCNTPPFGIPVIDPGTVSADINGDGQLTVLPATTDEWAELDYAGGGQIGPR